MSGGDRRLRVRGIRRDPPDLRKLASALIDLAQAQAEADASAEHARREAAAKRSEKRRPPTKGAA
jgi:hypothetical protein